MSQGFFKGYVDPLLDHLPSEGMHVLAKRLLHLAESNPATLALLEKFAAGGERFADERLKIELGGVEFENPVIVGAGWDKTGEAVKALHQLGFAGVEVGSVLAFPQEGNPKPRQWVIGPGVVMNRLGFNSPGMDRVAGNLNRYGRDDTPIGISVGKNKDVSDSQAPEAHAIVVDRLYSYASYFVINVSSPNTPGLRGLQAKGPLRDIVEAVVQTMEAKGGRKPLFIKIAPELNPVEVDDVIDIVVQYGLTGIIASNTTVNDAIKGKYGRAGDPGGLSGDDPEYRAMVNEQIKHIQREAGNDLEIIGVGGVKDAATALEKIRAGARAIQVVSAIRSEGTALPGLITRGLVEYMEEEGLESLEDIRGIDANR